MGLNDGWQTLDTFRWLDAVTAMGAKKTTETEGSFIVV